MKKREYCESHESIAYYDGFNGLEIKGGEQEFFEAYCELLRNETGEEFEI